MINNIDTSYRFNFKILNNKILYNPQSISKNTLYQIINDFNSEFLPCVGIFDSEGNNLCLGDILIYRLNKFQSYYYVDYFHDEGFILIPFDNNDTIWDNIDVLSSNQNNFTILGNKFSNPELYTKITQKYTHDKKN